MRATNKSDRAGRAARWVALATLTAMAAGLAGCVTAPPYSSYGAGYGAGYAAGSTAYGNTSYASSYTSGYGNTYGNGYGSYDPNAPQPYVQQPAPTYSQPNYSPYPSTYPNNGDQAYQAPADNRYGVVEYVEAVPVRGQPSGVGAVLGGVVGGLLGHQVGGGRGNTVATIGGAVAGAMAGNAVEGNTVVGQTYRVTLRLNDNSRVTLTQNNPNGLRAGDRARIENNMAVPY